MSRIQQNGEGSSQGNTNLICDTTQSWNFSNSKNSGAGNDPKSKTKLLASHTNIPLNKIKRLVGKSTKSTTAVQEADHEAHIWTERERRKKMKEMFNNLHALLPHLPPKADKSTIVEEAVNSIRSLKKTLQQLEKKKLEKMLAIEPSSSRHMAERQSQVMDISVANHTLYSNTRPPFISMPRISNCFSTYTSNNVVLNVSGEEAYINICTSKKPGLFTSIVCVMEKHKIEVVSAHVSSDYFSCMYMIHAHCSLSLGASDQIAETLMIEEVFRTAVAEMALYLAP